MSGTNVPTGLARRNAILDATLELIGEHGPDSVTHRAVARRAGVPLAATTYWFSSKEELLRETLVQAAREETERLEQLVLALVSAGPSADWAGAVAAALASTLKAEPAKQRALFELALDTERHPTLRAEAARVQAAHLRLAEAALNAVGADDPRGDAPIVVAVLSGLMLGQLASPRAGFEQQVLRPALSRLMERLTDRAAVPA